MKVLGRVLSVATMIVGGLLIVGAVIDVLTAHFGWSADPYARALILTRESFVIGSVLLLIGAGMARRGRSNWVVQPGTCRRCGYDRRGLADGAACPECGMRDR